MDFQALIRKIIPKDERFYDLMERQAELLHEAAVALGRFNSESVTGEEVLAVVQEFEHDGDKILHELENALAQTFVTPIDREDIHRLSGALDDILDLTKLTAQSYVLYALRQPTKQMSQLMEILVQATSTLRATLPMLRKHAYEDVITQSRQIFQFEKNADTIYRSAVAGLFRDPEIDAKELLRVKEVLEDVERAINRCEAVADVLINVAVKHG